MTNGATCQHLVSESKTENLGTVFPSDASLNIEKVYALVRTAMAPT